MATYESLTDEEKEDIKTYDNFLRGLFANLAKVHKDVNSSFWAQFAATRIDALIASIDADSIIPNSTHLANSTGLTQVEFATLAGIAKSLNQTTQANFPLLVKAIGTNAV